MEDENEYKKLPTDEKCVHKLWKARVAGYEEAIKLFNQIDDEKSPEWNKYLGLIKKFVTDSNAVAQEKGLEAALVFVENCGHAGKTTGEVMAGIVTKCLAAPKTKTKDLALQVTLMYVEIEKHEIVQEELMKGMEQKNPKVVAACVTTLHTALKQFGNKVITIKPMVKKIPVLLADRDKGVRDEMKGLVVEMHRWIGAAIEPHIASLQAVVQQELRESFTTGGAQPTRYLRSQQHRVRDAPSADAPDGAAEDEDVDAAGGDSVEMDPFDMLDPVEILSKLPKDFYEKLEATKWQERKEALDALDNLLKTAPRLEPGDYADLVRALKKVISKDANVMLVALGGRLLAAVASGLRNKFQPYATACVQAILEKFKEKKTNVVTALREAIDAIYPSTNLEAIMEDMLAAFDNKNPSIKAESAVFLARALCVTQPAAFNKKLIKAYVGGLLKLMESADPSVRDAAAEALGTATKLVGEKNIAPHIGKLEPLKEQKIKEFAEKAEIKVKVAAPKKETKLKVAPNAGKGDSKPAAGSAQPKPVKRPAADVISGKDINYGAAGRPDSWRNCNSELWGPSVVGSITLDETTEGVDYCNREKIRTRMTFTPEVATPRPAGSPVPGPSKKPRRLIADSRLSNSGSELEDSSSSDQEEMNQPYAVDMRDVICELREVAVLEEEGEVEAISCVSTIATIVGEMETIENVEGRVDGATGEDNAAGDFDASFSWSDDFSTFSGQEEQYTRDPGPRIPTENILDIFNAIWDLSIISLIVEQTNLYAWQTIAKMSELGALPKYLDLWVDTTVEEIRRLFSIMIYMSLNHRARLSEYWSTGTLGMPDFRKLMSKNRFQLLMRFLHFSDNDDVLTGLSGYQKKITKIAPILNHMNKKFAEICIPQRELSLDESLLLWKGRLSWEQFIRSKAARYGLKLFDLCEAATGYLIRTIIYAGKDSSFVEGALHGFDNKSAKVVLELMDGFLDVGHLVVMDNWYNQLALTRYLKKRQTDVLGTINKNRQQIPLAIKNLDEKRMQRGQQVACHCGDIAVIAWKDVKLVTVISTYHSNEQVVGRRSGQELIKPVAIDTYNKTMGGVDLKDMKLSNFPIERKRGRKWYMKVFVHFLNTSILNSYIIYCKNPSLTVKSHRDFRYSLADLLIRISQPVFVFRPNKDTTDVRLDRQPDHFPTHTANVVGKAIKHQRLRCRRCVATGKRTLVMSMCQKCKVALCLGKCWIDYHTKDKLV